MSDHTAIAYPLLSWPNDWVLSGNWLHNRKLQHQHINTRPVDYLRSGWRDKGHSKSALPLSTAVVIRQLATFNGSFSCVTLPAQVFHLKCSGSQPATASEPVWAGGRGSQPATASEPVWAGGKALGWWAEGPWFDPLQISPFWHLKSVRGKDKIWQLQFSTCSSRLLCQWFKDALKKILWGEGEGSLPYGGFKTLNIRIDGATRLHNIDENNKRKNSNTQP